MKDQAKTGARDYQYYFSQLQRIEEHREEKAEKEIRKIYRKILKETKQFIAEEYYQLAEDGKLTYEILRAKGQDVRFLTAVEQKLGDLSLDVSKEIKQTAEDMYKLAYDGLKDAVMKGKDSEAAKQFFEGVDTSTAQTMWATVDNTIMDIALEKNHKSITWDIKQEVARALMVGDRFETIAHRIADNMDRSYKKAILITRTEVGRVREAGHLASAKNLNDALKETKSGLRMVKKWLSMKDQRVRDHHVRMHNTVVEMDEPFVLPDGVKTQAPKQSGFARHDCNCRCTCLYPLMDDAEFFEATGKHFSDTKANMSRNHTYKGNTWPAQGTPISEEEFGELNQYATGRNVRLKSFENFDGDPALVRDLIDGISDAASRFAVSGLSGKQVTLHNSFTLDDDDFAMTKGLNIHINNFALRDKETLQKEYLAKVSEGWFVKGTDYKAIAYHEMGHVITNVKQIGYSKLWNDVLPGKTTAQRDSIIKKELSEYATTDPREAIAEAFAAYTCVKNPTKLALQILERCGIL